MDDSIVLNVSGHQSETDGDFCCVFESNTIFEASEFGVLSKLCLNSIVFIVMLLFPAQIFLFKICTKISAIKSFPVDGITFETKTILHGFGKD